jgi:hypothetical protein
MSTQIQIAVKHEENSTEKVTFKKSLLLRCQEEFQKEKQASTSTTKEQEDLMKEIESTTNAEKKKDLQVQLEELNSRLRKKYVGVNR